MPSHQLLRDRQVDTVLGVPIDVISWDAAIERIFDWADARESRTVCICNVHSIITARSHPEHIDAISASDMVTADGAPVAWMLRKQGHFRQPRISGPDLMWHCCRRAAQSGTTIFLYGSTPRVIRRLKTALRIQFPGIRIVGTFSPPFRMLSDQEDEAVVRLINDSGAQLVWVGLGCPKQEAWMFAQRGRIQAVMVGVGAAFDFHAGLVARAPRWMQRLGLEWLHRLSQNPRRLAKRYLVGNTLFVLAALIEGPRSRTRRARTN